MFRKRGDSDVSNFPVSRPIANSESYDDFLERLQTLFDAEDAEDYFNAIENAPARWQRKPELMVSKAIGYLRTGDESAAEKILDEIERVHPRFAPLYYYKANLYLQNMFPAHALRMIRKVRSLGVLDDEAENTMNEAEKISTDLIKETADEFGIPYDKMEKASWYHESAQKKLETGKLQAAEQDARETLRLIPNWAAPRNNHSYILYFMGRINEAFVEAQVVLSQDSNNLHALKNLVIFHVGIGEDEKAREYSAKLAEYSKNIPLDSIEVDMVISALSLVDDDEALWTLAQKYLKQDYEELLDGSWYALAVAGIHTGHLRQAQKLLEKNEKYYEPATSLLSEVRQSLKAGSSASLRPSYSMIGLLLPASVLIELITMLEKYTDGAQLPRHVQRKVDEYIEKRPFVINGLLRFMFEPGAAELIPFMLLSFQRPEVDARLLAFALGDRGTNQQRLHVLSAISELGRDVPPSPIRFWDNETNEWMDVDFKAQMLSDDFELNISPKAAVWAEKAHEADDISDKISLWRKAVETDPKSGYALHMLGIILIQNGQKEEGRKLAYRAVDADPAYMFAYANIALMETQTENPNIELITEYLSKVEKASLITVQTAFIMHAAKMMLAFDDADFSLARNEFEIALELCPDDPLLNGWDDNLKRGEDFAGGWMAKWREQNIKRAHDKVMKTKLNIESTTAYTLNSLNREVLGTTARIWELTPYGKKAELITKISERMQSAEKMKDVLDKFNAKEKTALSWVLENNGARSWKEFINQYGDDQKESPNWNYHNPKSIAGRLRHAGLLAKGSLNGEQVIFIPVDLRELIKKNL